MKQPETICMIHRFGRLQLTDYYKFPLYWLDIFSTTIKFRGPFDTSATPKYKNNLRFLQKSQLWTSKGRNFGRSKNCEFHEIYFHDGQI